MRLRLMTLLLLLSAAFSAAEAQIVLEKEDLKDRSNEQIDDSLRAQFDRSPYFTLYRDNYFVVGTDVTHVPNANNSDVKFQISIAQRLTKSTLPFGTYLFLMYTQGVVWDVFKDSMPMHDFTFNPGIGIGKPLFSHERFIGKATLLLEHMSNGRDSIWSRSWNRVAIGANIMIDNCITVDGKVWIPIVDGEHNRDILKYVGIFQGGVTVTTRKGHLGGSLHFVKRAGWNFNYNIIVDLFWRPWKQANQYFFLQWYNGYGESLIDYNQFHNRLRVGIVIKPRFFSEY